MFVCMCVHMCMYEIVYMCVSVCVCMSTHVCLCICNCMYVCVCNSVYVYICPAGFSLFSLEYLHNYWCVFFGRGELLCVA